MLSMETNLEIRKAIAKKRLRHYEVANQCGVTSYTFSHWLQKELPEEKKNFILGEIEKIVV